jgi:hypothetical protein
LAPIKKKCVGDLQKKAMTSLLDLIGHHLLVAVQ